MDVRQEQANPPGLQRPGVADRAPGAIRRLVAFPRSTEPELLDQPGHAREDLEANFRDIERVNRWLGGARLTLSALDDLLAIATPTATARTLSVLDIGSGSGDIPASIVQWGRQRALQVTVVACDVSLDVLRLATPERPGMPLVADGCRLPFFNDSFDIACCSLVLHHLQPPDALRVLREMSRVSRIGIVVNDLTRSRLGYAGSVLLGRVTTRNLLTRHDAPLSVRRAYTRHELRQLCVAAGLQVVHAHERFGYRTALALRTAP